MPLLSWIVVVAIVALLGTVTAAWMLKSVPRRPGVELPTEWALAPRSVFSLDERRVYRLLREALPHHVVLAKLPLVRFCQAVDPASGRYWYDLLGAAHVTFAVCSPNGRVLAAIDLDSERPPSRRVTRIKQAVLSACRVRYLRCPVDRPPSIAELQLLVPSSAAAMRGPHPSPLAGARSGPRADGSAPSREERASLWDDSISFQDSFFSHDSRSGGFGPSEFWPAMPFGSEAGRAVDPGVDGDERPNGATAPPARPSSPTAGTAGRTPAAWPSSGGHWHGAPPGRH